MTGILPIKKYGTQSALTDFREYSMLKPGVLAEFVGFTEKEVYQLCQEYHLDFDETQKWYDGYRFDTIGHVYCPNSIIELISMQAFDSYWTTTETYESLRDYIDLNMDGLKDAIIDMLGGKKHRIDTGTFQNDMTSLSSKDDILTLLVHLGYLAYNFDNKEVFIPNEEVRGEFIRAVKEGRHQELALLVELKWNKSAGKAISQIKEKQYGMIMQKYDYTGDLLLVGLNYSTKTGKHTCKIERYI